MSKKTPPAIIQDQIRTYGLTYTPPTAGAHLTGFPAQDLSGAECQAFDTRQLEAALASGLYQINIPKENES